jgi:carbon monoxide dehydrogenase subunit G
MNFHGRYSIPAPPQVVWEALNDPYTLKACIPGCEALERTDATHLAAMAILRIGPLKTTFKAIVEQCELDPPRRCVLKGEGQGGVAGFARGEAEVLLAPEDGGTALSYVAKASIGGKLAQIGQRLIDGAARQIADDFFSRFASLVAATAQTSAAAAVVPAPPPSSVPPTEEQIAGALPVEGPREGLAAKIWVAGLLGAIIVLLALFGLVFA